MLGALEHEPIAATASTAPPTARAGLGRRVVATDGGSGPHPVIAEGRHAQRRRGVYGILVGVVIAVVWVVRVVTLGEYRLTGCIALHRFHKDVPQSKGRDL